MIVRNALDRIVRGVVNFACGFFLACTVCLGGYIYWENVRPQKPMIFQLEMKPAPRINPNLFTDGYNAKLYDEQV